MKKVLTLTFILCFLNAKAQQQSFGFDFGLTFPSGKLGESDYNDSTTGYGTMGGNIKLGFQNLSSKGHGFFIEYANHSVSHDAEKLRSDINNDFKGSAYSVSEYTTKRYNIKGLNFGYANGYIKDKWGLYLNLGTGLTQCRSLALDYTVSNGIDKLRLKMDSDMQLTLNLNAKLYLGLNLGNRFLFTVGAGGQWQSVTFENDFETIYNGVRLDKGVEKENKPMSIINLNFGLRYKLGGK